MLKDMTPQQKSQLGRVQDQKVIFEETIVKRNSERIFRRGNTGKLWQRTELKRGNIRRKKRIDPESKANRSLTIARVYTRKTATRARQRKAGDVKEGGRFGPWDICQCMSHFGTGFIRE